MTIDLHIKAFVTSFKDDHVYLLLLKPRRLPLPSSWAQADHIWPRSVINSIFISTFTKKLVRLDLNYLFYLE